MCAPWIFGRTNICMTSEGTGKTSHTYLGAKIRWNDTVVCVLVHYWQGQWHREGYEFWYEICSRKIKLSQKNILIDTIDTHLNQAGRSRVMKLAGFDDESNRKIVRCLLSLNDLLEYIQQQLSGFSQGMATKMSRIARFTNMEGSAKYTG